MTTPVAIIGFACRLAGAGTSAELWARLNNGLSGDPTTAPHGASYSPEEQLAGQFPGQTFSPGFRWPSALLKQVELDPADYGIAPESARELDNVQLLGMSLVCEALQHAGTYGVPGSAAAPSAQAPRWIEERAGLVLGFSHSPQNA